MIDMGNTKEDNLFLDISHHERDVHCRDAFLRLGKVLLEREVVTESVSEETYVSSLTDSEGHVTADQYEVRDSIMTILRRAYSDDVRVKERVAASTAEAIPMDSLDTTARFFAEMKRYTLLTPDVK